MNDSAGTVTAGTVTTTTAGPRATGALRNAVLVGAVGKSLEIVTLLALAVVVPRALGATDYGRFSVALTIVTLGSLALTLGGPPLVTRFVPAVPVGERMALARALGGRLARTRTAILTPIVVVAAAASVVVPDTLPPAPTTIVLLALIVNVATTILLLLVLGLGRAGAWSIRYPLQNAALVVIAVCLYAVGGADGAIAAILLASLVAAGLAAVVSWPVLTADVEPPSELPEGALRFGALHGLGAAAMQFTHRGGVLAVAVLAASSAETGYAALAIGVALGATYAVLQLFTVALPHVLDDGFGADRSEELLRRLAGGLLAIVVGTAVVLAPVLDDVVPRVFGSDFGAASDAFGPALAIVVLAPLGALTVQLAAVRMRPEVALASGIAALIAFAVVAVVAVPQLGAAGGTAAGLAGVAGAGVTSCWMLRGAIGVRITVTSFGCAALVLVLAAVT